MSCCFSVYFPVVFKTVLRGLLTFGFVGFKIVFWVLFVELGGLPTPFSFQTLFSHVSLRGDPCHFFLVETLFASLRAQVTYSSLFRPAFSLYPRSLYILVHSRLEDNSSFSYTILLLRPCATSKQRAL